MNSGFVANSEKSIWEPKQIIEWLGFEWNLENCTLQVPERNF